MKSGRVRIPATETKKIIYVPSGGGPAIRYYRVYNSGRDKEEDITVLGAANGSNILVKPYESVDFGVKTSDIQVTAGDNEAADVIYEFLG